MGRKKSLLAQDLESNLGPDMQKWLLKEMAQNRSRKQAKHKVTDALHRISCRLRGCSLQRMVVTFATNTVCNDACSVDVRAGSSSAQRGLQVYPYAANFAHGDQQSIVDDHDLRGTHNFVALAKSKPNVLMPPLLLQHCEEQGKPISNSTLAAGL